MSKASPERKQTIINALEQGMTREAAAGTADVHKTTFYRWMEADATFRTNVEKAEQKAESRFLLRVTQAASSGTWQAAAWWLERRRPQHYALKQRSHVEVTGEGGGPVKLAPAFAEWSDEKLEATIKELEEG